MSVSVVGAGVMGLATAWALSRRGHRVSVFEQGPVPNPLASSADDHRLIRAAYGGKTGYMRLALEAHAAWQPLWRETGTPLYHPTGVLALGAANEVWARQSAEALESAGIAVRSLSSADVAQTYPLLRGDGLQDTFYFDEGGVLLAGRILDALITQTAAHGGALRAHSPVVAVDPKTASLRLADGSAISSDMVVVAAGPWTTRLLPDFAHRVTPSRQSVLYLEAPDDTKQRWADMPMVLEIDRAGGFYLVPPVAATGLKVGLHRFSLAGDPDDVRTLAAADVEAVRAVCRSRIDNFDHYAIARNTACYYTVETDERFIVEPLSEQCWIMTGFSGHGFKFAALLGLELAEVIDGIRDADSFVARAAGH